MNHNDPSNQIDKLLQKWAEEHQPTQDHLDGLIDRVQQSLRANPVVPNTNHSAELRNAHATTYRRATLMVLAMAASVLIGWVGWQGAFHWLGKGTQAQLPGPVKIEQETTSELKQATKNITLIQEAQRIYDNRVSWLAETDREVLVELSSESPAKSSHWLSIHLSLEREATSEGNGEPRQTWHIHLMVPSEQTVRIEGSDSMPALTLWPYVTADGLVMIDTSIGSTTNQDMAASYSEVLAPGTETKTSAPGGKYVMTQRVEYLDDSSI